MLRGLRLGIIALALGIWPAIATSAQETINLDACVEAYDPEVEYFPEQVEVEAAAGFTVEYFANYKVVRVYPYPGAPDDEATTYLLVQCGTPAPDGYDDALLVEVPVTRAVALSTTYLPHYVELGALDALIGVDTLLYTNTPEVLAKAEAGELVEVGGGASGGEVNFEALLDAEAQVVFTDSFGDAESGLGARLADTDIVVAIAPDYNEPTPLGRAEWLKYTALFFNAEAEAEALYDERAAAYAELAALAAEVPDDARVTVLSNTVFGDSWYMPGTDSYAAALIRDAGGEVAMADDPQIAGNPFAAPLSFEAVYAGALDAEVWLANIFNAGTRDELLAQDARYADFAAFQSGRVYNNSARSNANGGSDYFESGVTNPQIVLADLIAIFYPDLLPDHDLYYYVALP
jgi:iron complex transport system substrate-binding protein